MNRIILIGNGFDLAHGLPTSYKDFIDYYWEDWAEILLRTNSHTKSDGLTTITHKNTDALWSVIIGQFMSEYGAFKKLPGKYIIESIKDERESVTFTMCPFLELINKSIDSKNWVDIETEYYLSLKSIIGLGNKRYNSPRDLDKDFELLKLKLVEYLSALQEERIKPNLKEPKIEEAIYAPFCSEDIAVQGKEIYTQFLKDRWEDAQSEDEWCRKIRAHDYGIDSWHFRREIEGYLRDYSADIAEHLRNVERKNPNVARFFQLPEQIMLLNFNYTKTAKLYLPEGSDFCVNHIHGELNNEKNPIIFGYGDELDENYKTISNLNDNDYLTNIKSIHYLETDNYRRLLQFVDSAPFQIYIMGHSCGNSDRTLLNTLFEHRNCISIKPFYHMKADGSDNYFEIIQNISRNFNNKQMMRDRVVNKKYCSPLLNPA